MSTGFKGQGVRKKTWQTTYSAGDTVAYTIPSDSDVTSAKVFINKIEGDNIDAGEGVTITAQRLVQGTWRSIGQVASIANPVLGQANENIALYVSYSYPTGSELNYTANMYESVASSNPVTVSFDLLNLMPGDRILVSVDSSGETFDVDGFIVEETATTTSI